MKLNNKTLTIVLVVLATVFAISQFTAKKNESTFKKDIISVDTSLVTTVYIYPKAENGKEIKLEKTESGWSASMGENITQGDAQALQGLLSNLMEIKTTRLAANKEEKWSDFEVTDSLGTRIKLMAGKEPLLDLICGKFSFNQMKRSGITYIRITNENEVYATDGFLAMNVNQGFASWRNKTVIKGNSQNWMFMAFSYPSDSGFVVNKGETGWDVSELPGDSLKITQYMNRIQNLTHRMFEDEFDASGKTPSHTLSISGNNMPNGEIKVSAFPGKGPDEYIIHSTHNPKVYFKSRNTEIFKQIFISKEALLSEALDS